MQTMLRTVIGSLLSLAVLPGCAAPVRMTLAPGPLGGCRSTGIHVQAPVVAWIQPAHAGERRALDARCAQVGRPHLPSLPPAAPSPRAQRVLVATWNMHDGRGDVLALVKALRHGTPETPAPDAVVVLLQEVVRAIGTAPPATARGAAPTGVQDIPAIVGRLGWHLAYLPGKRNRLRPDGAAGADRGVAILSSLPISHLEAIELPIERQRRVVLSGVVHGTASDGRPWRLRVVSVHLENRSGIRRFWSRAGASRTRQTEALIEALSLSPTEAAPAPLPMLVGGDFNTWLGDEKALRLLRARFGAWPAEDPRPTVGFRGWRLDYLFPRLPAGVPAAHRRLDSMFGSDHYPVVAALDFGRAGASTRTLGPLHGVTTCMDCN